MQSRANAPCKSHPQMSDYNFICVLYTAQLLLFGHHTNFFPSFGQFCLYLPDFQTEFSPGRARHAGQNQPLLVVAEVHDARTLDLLADPVALLQVVDVHVLHADTPGIEGIVRMDPAAPFEVWRMHVALVMTL